EADDRARVIRVARIACLQVQVERRQRFGRPEPEPSVGARTRRELWREPSLGRLDRGIGFERARGVNEAVAQNRVAPMRLLGEQLAAGAGGQALECAAYFIIFYKSWGKNNVSTAGVAGDILAQRL